MALLNGLPAGLLQDTEGLGIADTLNILHTYFPEKMTFSSSFSYEDQVITHMIAGSKIPISVFTLDTGRLFAETYQTWQSTKEHYDLQIAAFCPDPGDLELFLREKGPDAFYTTVGNRRQCCHIRKVAPLKRALEGKAVWITGLRGQHSPDRQQLAVLEWDDDNRIIKYNPLLHWTTEEVIAFIRKHKVPYNNLHEKGFVSIGCAPCTRAIRPGEDFRAGRWWWEDGSQKECGLHLHTKQ